MKRVRKPLNIKWGFDQTMVDEARRLAGEGNCRCYLMFDHGTGEWRASTDIQGTEDEDPALVVFPCGGIVPFPENILPLPDSESSAELDAWQKDREEGYGW